MKNYIIFLVVLFGLYFLGLPVHELGHYIMLKIYGIPSFIVFNYKFGDTTSFLSIGNSNVIGGYVTYQVKLLESLQIYQKIIVLVAGVFFEIVLYSIVAYITTKIKKVPSFYLIK